MANNTGNPVEPFGSDDPRDLIDNAAIGDKLINSSDLTWPGRLGKVLKTWAGIMQQVTDYLIAQGYESVYLIYGAGVVVQRQTQAIQRDGELYRVMNAADIPLTLTGTWATDAPKLQAVGDAALRVALASSSGATMVHRGISTVDADLTAIEGGVETLQEVVSAMEESVDENSLKIKSESSKSYNSVNGFLASQNPWGVRCLNIFGDSISFGANAQDIERDSWVGIIKKMLNIEFGSTNIGVLNVLPQTSNAEGVFVQYFQSAGSQTGTWTSIADAAAAHIPSGYALQSSVVGSTQVLKAPLSQRYMRIWYDGTVTGEIEVVINGAVVQTLVSTGTGTGYERGAPIELGTFVASNQGVVTFTLRNKSGTIRLTCLEFTNDTSGNSFRVHNFSRDGRSGKYASQDVIKKGCAGCYAFVWALGTNDVTGYDSAAQAAYDQRIDWIIAAAAANRTRVVFIDWLFQQPYSHGLRASIRRGAASIPGSILIEADQLWTVSGAQYTESERVSRGLSAGVHPEEIGHRLVAEALAQRLGLSASSKRQAIRRDPMWKALDISASGFANNSTEPGKISAYRVGDRFVEVIVNLSTVPAIQTTLGTISSADFTGFAGANFKSNPDVTGKNGLFTITSSGSIVYRPDPTITGTPTVCSLYATIPFHDSSNWF